jgi:hypothetical protein
VAFLAEDKSLAMAGLALAMFLLFFATGPVNTLILETVPVNLRASAMALSIFMIHLFGDMWSPELVGHLSDGFRDTFASAHLAAYTPDTIKLASEAYGLKKAVLILPVALAVAALFWIALAVRMRKTAPQPSPVPP